MSTNFVYSVPSAEATNFTEALVTNANSAMNNLPGLPNAGSGYWFIRAIMALATENYGPSFTFFGSKNGFTLDPATDFQAGVFAFSSAMGVQVGGSGLWRYYVDGLAIPYIDLDQIGTVNPPNLHVILGNISATGKSAYPAGKTQVTFWLEMAQAF